MRQGTVVWTINYGAATGAGTFATHAVTTYEYTDARHATVRQGYASAALTGTVTALKTTTSEYDAAGQLIKVTHDAVSVLGDDHMTVTTGVVPTETYEYDKRGNLLKSVDAGGAATYAYYDDMDRKVAEIRHVATGFVNDKTWVYTAYAYDANGNLVSTKVYEGNAYPTVGTTPPGSGASNRRTRSGPRWSKIGLWGPGFCSLLTSKTERVAAAGRCSELGRARRCEERNGHWPRASA